MTKLAENVAEAFRLCNEQRRQLEEQSAKLSRAMAVVEAAVRNVDSGASCDFCKGGQYVFSEPELTQHDETCPLLAGGFIDREGKRLP